MDCPNRMRPMWQALMGIRTWRQHCRHGVAVGAGRVTLCSCRADLRIRVSSQFSNCTSTNCYATRAHVCPASVRPIPSCPDCNTTTHTQPGWPNAHLDDAQFQIFNELRGKLQDIWRAVKALVAARKNGPAAVSNADAEWFHLGFCSSTDWPSESKFTIFEANPNKIAIL